MCVCVCLCDYVRGRLCAHLPQSVHEEDWERGSSVSAKAGVEWRYRQSLASTSPATGGSFIFPVHSLSLISPDNHEYGCLSAWSPPAFNGWNREKQLSAVLMSQNIVIAVLARCIRMTCFVVTNLMSWRVPPKDYLQRRLPVKTEERSWNPGEQNEDVHKQRIQVI